MKFDRKQRFSIRKYSVGVASVLIGSVLAGTTIASADTEVKVDDTPSSSTTVTSEAAKGESNIPESSQSSVTYSANPTLPSVSSNLTEKAEETVTAASKVEGTTPQSKNEKVEENNKNEEAKAEVKKEDTVETKTEVAEEVAKVTEKTEEKTKSEVTESQSNGKTTPSVKEQLVFDKKVPGLDIENATINPKGGFDIAFTKEAQEQYRTSLAAYIARRRNYNRRGSFRDAGAGTAEDPDYEFKKVMTPIVPGLYADKASVAALVINPENAGDFNFDVWYKKLGSVVLVDEQGNYVTTSGDVTPSLDQAAHIQYANDPSDPTRAWFTKVPTVPTGWEIKLGQTIYGYDEAHQTVNPNQKDDLDAIGRDTKIVIVKQVQKAVIKYVNEKGNVELSHDEVAGKSGEAIGYSTAAKISAYKRQGYELVSDGFTSASNKNFDFDASVNQEFTVVLRERIEPIDPDKPTPTPDKPVDPKDPDTPKWPDPVKDVVNKDDVTRTIHYVYEDGSKAKDDVAETLHFKRFAYVNLVTGHIDYRDWTTNDDTFDAVTSPVIKGYTADKLVVPTVSGVKAGTADSAEVVTYVKDAQKAVIKYVNEKGNVEVDRDTVNGKSGEVIDYSTTNKINELRRKGYELVSDGFTSASNKNFDFDAKVDQEFTVVIRERVVPVGPEDPNPTPDTPYDPTDPNTPNWPKTVDKIPARRILGTRTVRYLTEVDGVVVPKPVRERVTFERIVLVNLVTGEMTPQSWKLVSAVPIEDAGANVLRSRSRRALVDMPAHRAKVASLASTSSRSRSRRALADTPTTISDDKAELKGVVTPVLPGQYANKESAGEIVIDPEHIGDFNFDVWYKSLVTYNWWIKVVKFFQK